MGELYKEIEEMNLRFAIKVSVKRKLLDILPNLTRQQLLSLASENQVAGRSKMNKAELISSLFSSITDIVNLEDAFVIAYPKELQFFDRIARISKTEDADIVPGNYLYLMKKGLIFSFYYNNELSFVVPDEVKVAYKKINQNKFNKIYDRYQEIYSYICALVNLYGIYKPKLLLEIFNAQNDQKLDYLEFMQTYLHFCQRDQYFYMKREYIACDIFQYDDSDEEFNELDSKYEKVDRYVPDKQELLRYADGLYYEKTPQLIALKEYIMKNICKDEELVNELVDDIQLQCSDSWQFSMEHIFMEFERRDIRFRNKQTIEQLLPYIVDVINNTRLWANCGHTPSETKKVLGATDYITKSTPFYVKASSEAAMTKVGRNEPCPCGSGKKYKKCCGSN